MSTSTENKKKTAPKEEIVVEENQEVLEPEVLDKKETSLDASSEDTLEEVAPIEDEAALEEKKKLEEEKRLQELEAKRKLEEEEEQDRKASPSIKKFENKRYKFLKFYKMHKIFQWIAAAVAILIVVFAWVGGSNLGFPLWAIILCLVSGLAVFLLYGFIMKIILKKKMKTYFVDYYNAQYGYVLDGLNVNDIDIGANEKIEDMDFKESQVYRNITTVGSRASSSFTYANNLITIADAAGSVKYEKSLFPVFVGKYLVSTSNFSHEDERVIIYLKGNSDANLIPPTDVEDLLLVNDDNVMSVYASKKELVKEVLTNEVRKILKEFKTDNVLLDAFISLKKNRVYIGLGYADDLMVVPLEKAIKMYPIKHFKQDLEIALRLIEEVNKEPNVKQIKSK